MIELVYNWIKVIQNSVYPNICLICGAKGEQGLNLCLGCYSDLPWNTICCHQCALPLTSTNKQLFQCGECLQQPPPFDRSLSPLIYNKAISRLISEFKFSGKLYNGELLSHLLATHIEQKGQQLPSLIIPVPLHRTRLQKRGYNQALELARPLSRRFGIPIAQDIVMRSRATLPQSSLEKKARYQNIRGSFEVRKQLAFAHVVIVDDVITTGATVAELALTLKRAGVERVDAWSVARTLRT